MTKQISKLPKKIETEELNKRQQKAKENYFDGYYQSYQYSAGHFVYPATTLHDFKSIEELVDFVAEHAKQGRERFKGEPMRSAPGYYEVRLYKSQAEIDQDLKNLFDNVAADYQAEIDAHNEEQRQILINQLVEQEKAKERKKEQEREAKILAAAAATADEYFASVLSKDA